MVRNLATALRSKQLLAEELISRKSDSIRLFQNVNVNISRNVWMHKKIYFMKLSETKCHYILISKSKCILDHHTIKS